MAYRVRGIVVHVSASTWGEASVIDGWHKERGWSGIGYHGVILNGRRQYAAAYQEALDGHIQPGRPETAMGAHCLAKGMNTCSLGVCLIGNPGWAAEGARPADSKYWVRKYLTERQLNALVHWLAVNCRQYGLNPLGTLKRPEDGKIVPVITQHSDHDKGKPFCASLRLEPLRQRVATAMKG